MYSNPVLIPPQSPVGRHSRYIKAAKVMKKQQYWGEFHHGKGRGFTSGPDEMFRRHPPSALKSPTLNCKPKSVAQTFAIAPPSPVTFSSDLESQREGGGGAFESHYTSRFPKCTP